MPVLFYDEKTYVVDCPACCISELMIFRKKKFDLTYRHAVSVRLNNKRSEGETEFVPIRSIFGDKPPKTCPKCKGKLKVVETRVMH
jgi:hypothetical protein